MTWYEDVLEKDRYVVNNQYSIVRFEPIAHGTIRKFPIEDWDVQKATNLVDLKNYKCFWFEKIQSEIDEEPGKFTVRKRVIKTSGHYFIDCFVETMEDVLVRDSELAEKMEQKGWKKVATSINWNFSYGFDENKDNIVELK